MSHGGGPKRALIWATYDGIVSVQHGIGSQTKTFIEHVKNRGPGTEAFDRVLLAYPYPTRGDCEGYVVDSGHHNVMRSELKAARIAELPLPFDEKIFWCAEAWEMMCGALALAAGRLSDDFDEIVIVAVDAVYADLYSQLEALLPSNVMDRLRVVHGLYSSALIRGTTAPPERLRNERRCVERANKGQVMIADIGQFFTHHLRTEFGLVAPMPRFRQSLSLADPDLAPPGAAQISRCFEEYAVDASVPIVAFGGRADPIKGFDVLIEAAEMVESRFQLIALCVPYSPMDERIVAIRSALSSVKFQYTLFDRFSRDIFRCLCASSATRAVVVPSRGEPVGLIPQEVAAWARGGSAVTVVSAVDGLCEQVTDGHDGFTFRSEDPVDLARQLTAALELPAAARRTLQANAYGRMRRERDYDVNFAVFVEDVLSTMRVSKVV